MSVSAWSPVFPQRRDELGNLPADYGVGGLSLREYYAGQALAGILSNQTQIDGCGEDARADHIGVREAVARKSFLIADAMIAEENRREGS